jgi:hypothetical protein
MKQRLFLVTLIAIGIAISLAGLTAVLSTIANYALAQNATVGNMMERNLTERNSTEVLVPSEDGSYSEDGGWG